MFRRKQTPKETSSAAAGPEIRTYSVSGISCAHCKQAIETQFALLDGVESFSVDVDAKTVQVIGGSDSDAVAAIEKAGYSVD